MTDQAPLDANVVGRILRRASDLERAGDVHDEAATIAESSLIAAAEEVGLSVEAVRRSIAVERLGPLPGVETGYSGRHRCSPTVRSMFLQTTR
jgi:hypothetical protein